MHPRLRLLILMLCCGLVAQASVQSRSSEDVTALLRLLANPATEWAAASRLQKAGPAAIAALVENLAKDGFRDRDHGNHSPTMRVLEKIGDPAVGVIEKSLVGAETRFVESAVLALARIGTPSAIRVLFRIADTSEDPRVQELALSGLVQRAFDFDDWRHGRAWESCLRHESLPACPLNGEAANVAAAVKPYLEQTRLRLPRQTASVRLAAAQILALWGDTTHRAAGEDELQRLASGSGNAYIQQHAIRVLGHLGVEAVRPVLRNIPPNSDDDVRRAVAESFARLGDEGYRPIIAQLMTKSGKPANPDFNWEEFRVKWAIQFAGRSRDMTFIPRLLDFLDDPAFADPSLDALRKLTFQDFGRDPKAWRAWWAGNQNIRWESHLARFVENVLPQVADAEPWILNEWMDRLEDADHQSVLPFVRAYFRHPRLDISQVGPNTFRGGGGTPRSLILLLNLASQGSRDARQLLYECSSTRVYPTAIDCGMLVAVFDRQTAVERLRALRSQPYPYWVAHALVQLGDRESIPLLIEQLEAGDSATRSLALQDLKLYTQENFGEDAKAWRQWWVEHGENFTVNLRAARIDLECCRV